MEGVALAHPARHEGEGLTLSLPLARTSVKAHIASKQVVALSLPMYLPFVLFFIDFHLFIGTLPDIRTPALAVAERHGGVFTPLLASCWRSPMWRPQAEARLLTFLKADTTTGYFGVYLNKSGKPKPYPRAGGRRGKRMCTSTCHLSDYGGRALGTMCYLLCVHVTPLLASAAASGLGAARLARLRHATLASYSPLAVGGAPLARPG